MTTRQIKPWLFLFPALLIYIIVIFIPAIYTSYLSLFRWNGVSPNKTFVGLQNFVDLFTIDNVFRQGVEKQFALDGRFARVHRGSNCCSRCC